MALRVGQRLLHYEILALIGSGGAGDVYRARDTKLGREVAIKALSGSLARDTERLTRLTIEAKALAALNHTNLAHVYGIERAEAEELTIIVMELVPGETLATRLQRGALPVEEALGLGRQIALGLEEAHEQGIVHRDLKPDNVCVTEGGVAKVLDFGLAKLSPAGQSDGEGVSLVTEEGVLNGTPPYMSPEHIGGGLVDRRTDIWALGCVLFECLTGRRAFERGKLHEVIMAIQSEDPDWDALPADVSQSVRHLLARMLEKDPRLRLQDMGEVRIALTPGMSSWMAAIAGEASSATVAKAPGARARWFLGGVLAALALGAASSPFWKPASGPARVEAAHLDVTPSEAKFRPIGAQLALIEESIRGGLVPSLGVFTLVDREPLELAQVRIYHDTSSLHLRNALSGLSHTFTVDRELASAGWTFYHCPRSGELRRRVLREAGANGVALRTPVGTTILDHVGRQDFGLNIRGELSADLGRGHDLLPRVLLVVTSKRWWYAQPETDRRLSLEMSSVAAMWWIPGTAEFLDETFAGLAEVPRIGIDSAWSEREIVTWRELSLDSSDSAVEISQLPELGEFRARFDLEDSVAVRPKYHFAVDELLSEHSSSDE